MQKMKYLLIFLASCATASAPGSFAEPADTETSQDAGHCFPQDDHAIVTCEAGCHTQMMQDGSADYVACVRDCQCISYTEVDY